jgi:phosphate acyltransferase
MPAKIAVDAMGGDLGPCEAVEAVKEVLASAEADLHILLVGQQEVLSPLLSQAGLQSHPKLTVVHATEVITMEDKPLKAIKTKKDSSMIRAIELVKSGEARVAVSCGNTGALMAGATLRLRTMNGVSRPALGAVIPREGGHFILIDVGANPDARPEHVVHNAILGSNYARVILGIASPRVALLTIGTEEGKGNALIAETHEQLRKLGAVINYTGPIEGFQVFRDEVDVVVCDGFVGNTLLKTWESLTKFFSATLRTELKKNPARMIGAKLAQGAFAALKDRMNPDRYAGAPLLGVRGTVLKTHGSSTRHAWANAIRAADKIIRQDLYQRMEQDIAKANELITILPQPSAAPFATAPTSSN